MNDLIRVAVVILFFLMVGQALAISHYYQRVRRRMVAHGRQGGLLPLHVILVSIALIAFGVEAVVTNYQRVTEPATFWLWYNLALFAVTNYGLLLVLRYERRRYVLGNTRTRTVL